MHPILYKFSSFQIESYSLFLGMAIGLYFYLFITLSNYYKLPEKYQAYNAFGFIFTFIGAKLFFILFSNYDKSISMTQVLMGGGQVFWGGLIFSVLYILLVLKLKKVKSDFFMAFTPSIIFAHSLGRVGCFLGGCCYGHILEVLPVQLVESVFLLALGIYIFKISNGVKRVLIYLVSYSVFRFVVEFYREDVIRGIYGGLSTSQYISILIFGLSLFFLFKFRKHRFWNI